MISIIVSVLTFLPLLVVAFAHLLWALGTAWPLQSEALLAQTVVGSPGIRPSRSPRSTAAITRRSASGLERDS